MRRILLPMLSSRCTQVDDNQSGHEIALCQADAPIGSWRVHTEDTADKRRVPVEEEVSGRFQLFIAFSDRRHADEIRRGNFMSTSQTRNNGDGTLRRVDPDQIGDSLILSPQAKRNGCKLAFAAWLTGPRTGPIANSCRTPGTAPARRPAPSRMHSNEGVLAANNVVAGDIASKWATNFASGSDTTTTPAGTPCRSRRTTAGMSAA